MNEGDERELWNQKVVAQRYLNLTPRLLSSYAFVQIFLWQNFFSFDFQIIDDQLCIFAKNEAGCFLYLPPLGASIKASIVDECFKKMEDGGVGRIENVSEADLSYFPSGQFRHYKKGNEYYYRREDVAALRGNKYKSQRAAVNQFIKNNTYQYLPYSSSMAKQCEDLYARWAKGRCRKYPHEDIYQHMITESARVHNLARGHYQKLNLIGRVIEIEGKVQAYTFGFVLNENTFCVLMEIAELDIKGLATSIFWRFCQDAAVKSYAFINVMDDCELKNIGKTKKAFHPVELLPVYVIEKKEHVV